MRILLTNDDGVHAQGLRDLAMALSQIASVTVVAPDSGRSGASSQITARMPIRLQCLREPDCPYEVYSCTGTPVDCVKLACHVLFGENQPDLIVSGINHGRNDGICTLYSGTVGAAIEGAIARIRSIAFSLNDHSSTSNFSYVCEFAQRFIPEYMKVEQSPTTLLNINFPKGEPRGFRWTPQARSRFINEYMESTPPYGDKVYWMQGEQIDPDERLGTDFYYLEQGYITLTPIQIDLTDYQYLQDQALLLQQVIRQWEE